MRKKLNKPLLGFISLIAVIIMTVIAYYIPSEDVAATEGSPMTDTLKVVVYDQYPSVSIEAPSNGDSQANSVLAIDVFYENIDYIDFKLTYSDEDGNPIEISLPRFIPSDLDDVYSIASGDDTVEIDLGALNIRYQNYTLSASAHSPIGYDEDSVEFSYIPGKAIQSTETEENGDPILYIEHDKGVEKLEIMVYDKDGKPIMNEPLVINIPSPYNAGKEKVVLPLGRYGLQPDDYYVGITSYKHVQATDENGDLLYDEDGNPIMTLIKIDAPAALFGISYEGMKAINAPNTGQMLASLNIAKSDYLITLSIVMALACFVGFYSVYKTKHRVNYRKNYRRGYAGTGAKSMNRYPSSSIRNTVARNRKSNTHHRR